MTDRALSKIVRIAPGALSASAHRNIAHINSLSRTTPFGGRYRLGGTVKIDADPDIPVRRRVILVHRSSGAVVAQTWSSPTTGAYEFLGIKIGPWVVVSIDHTNNYNAVVADCIDAELM